MKKIARCARQDDYNVQRPAKIGIVTLKNGENEDPAKMTYSIPDFMSRNTTKNQDFFQVLEGSSSRNKIKY